MSRYFSSLVEQSISRTTEATLSLLGITNPQLRDHLGQQMRSECGKPGSFLSSPVFEQTFGWEEANVTMRDLADREKLLSPAIIEALNNPEKKRYRFGSDWKPFTHQLASWKSLLEKKHSIVVTSGTGSGKTECFMVPVLEDLYQEYRSCGEKPLVGVRAIYLYPLNALINSQRERLDAWTRRFDNGIRFCLYNGKTEEKASKVVSKQRLCTNEILSRELLRREPAPILVTNGTMLEYMMVRQIDAPIIDISRKQKSLRWIVLDEAHSYVGSQAAELSLQLRRVMQAFGVGPKDVRFVATSATIAGEDAASQLKQFLSDLSGVPQDQIDVWGGKRIVPSLPPCKEYQVQLEELESMGFSDPQGQSNLERFEALVHSPEARMLRDALVTHAKPRRTDELAELLTKRFNRAFSADEVMRWLDLCTGTQPSDTEPSFLKVRSHFFQRTTQGLWCCFNASCTEKNGTSLEKGWPFGNVYVGHRQTCSCGSPVYEMVFCQECNEPHLLARDKNGKLVQWESYSGDEFSLLSEGGGNEDEDVTVNLDEEKLKQIEARKPRVLSALANHSSNVIHLGVNRISGEFDEVSEQRIYLGFQDRQLTCCACAFHGHGNVPFYRRALVGGPFYVINAVPTVLEYCPDFNDDDDKNIAIGAQSLPGRGRRLITFTDSRQGTARMAVSMQQEAERNRVRGMLLDTLKEAQAAHSDVDIPNAQVDIEALKQKAEEAKKEAQDYRSWGMPLEAKQSEERAERLFDRVKALSGVSVAIPMVKMTWKDVVEKLAQKADIKGPMLTYNKSHKQDVFGESDGPLKLAELLLLREFRRRPKRRNSLETQGMVMLHYHGMDKVEKAPSEWERYKLSLQDWKDFLKVAMDFYVRDGGFLQMELGMRHWIGNKFSTKELRNPNSQEADEMRIKKWPQIRANHHNQRLAKLLLLSAKLDPRNTLHVDTVNTWLSEAWKFITRPGGALTSDENRFSLRRENLLFSLVCKAYICPVTNKLIDTTFKGFTPYLPEHVDFSNLTEEKVAEYQCVEVECPEIWKMDRSQYDYDPGLRHIRRLVEKDERVQKLRSLNLWTNINDRAVEGGFYYRTAEHSAQQPSDRLEDYEEQFKQGKINVLNCSTTMEMGVDIGGISAVVMNNVPPHPANYLQRAGRAGRSKESRAISYTLCKSNPHDQLVFSNPLWPFETRIPAPAVALNSARLVQRHINAFLLTVFWREEIGETATERTSLNTKWFFDNEAGDSICDRFSVWLQRADLSADMSIKELTRGTSLSTATALKLRSESRNMIQNLNARWLEEYRYFQGELIKAKPNGPYFARITLERKRHCEEYLLRDLSARNYLPGYGFPTDVVTFDNFTMEDYFRELKREKRAREDNVSRYKGLPSRNLAIAIREYAPGAEVVLDGRVYRSAGVSLHWHQLHFESKEAQKIDRAWWCGSCGEIGYEEGVSKVLELQCTNPDCLAPIPQGNIKDILKPAGFVTDSYEPVTNDVTHQKYIPVESARVMVTGQRLPLPNPALGYMTYGVDGKVFHHSTGEFGHGFAICFTCGRASSMYGPGEYPPDLMPTTNHFSPRPRKEDKDQQNKRLPCPGSESIRPNVSLGVVSTTDVFELVLRNPVTGEFLGANTKHQNYMSVAITLAVSLRFALAERLGISASELGYAVKPSRLQNGEVVNVIQLFDSISGGAGFASSAPIHIEHLLKKMVERLHCEHCSTACSECLLDPHTRHDHDDLDRLSALQWLGNDFQHYIGLPESEVLLPSAKYSAGTLEDVLRKHVNSGASRLILWLKGDSEEWDLGSHVFKRSVFGYLVQDELKVDLILSSAIDSEDIRSDLHGLEVLGARICQSTDNVDSHIVAQVISGDTVHTFASRSKIASVPGSFWLKSDCIVVGSNHVPLAEVVQLDCSPSIPAMTSDVNSYELTDQVNGKLSEFGDNLLTKLLSGSGVLSDLFESESIKSIAYTDRYLQSPMSVLLLGSVLSGLKKHIDGNCSVHIVTLFKDKTKAPSQVFHDWADESDFEGFTNKWLNNQSGQSCDLKIVKDSRDIPHHRVLVIGFSTGRCAKIRFDQGVGYWRIKYGLSANRYFDFGQSVDYQLAKTAESYEDARVYNGDSWATDIIVEVY